MRTVNIPAGQSASINATNGSALSLTSAYSPGANPTNITLAVDGTVDLHVLLSGCNFNTQGGRIHFIGSNSIGYAASADIESNIYGPAHLHLGGVEGEGCAVTLGGDVGRRITVDLDAWQPVLDLNIVHPDRFFGLVNFSTAGPPGGPGCGTVDLTGVTATSGTLKGGHLSLYDGATKTADIRVGGFTGGLGLYQTSTGVTIAQVASGTDGMIPLAHVA
jgi:hypothetical protein